MRIVFMGTPDFAVGSLKALAESEKHEILAVVTQPDRPKGRGNRTLMPPVKEYALGQGFKVFQPRRVKEPEFVGILRGLAPELIVVAAFGQMLSRDILSLPEYGCVNVHASLLPRYRGAAPIHYAVMNGEKESGVTIMKMDIGMDTGDMLACVSVPIGEDTTMGELHDLLRDEGARLLLEVIEKIGAGTARPVPQNGEKATYAHLLDRGMERIDWSKSARDIHNLIRAFNPAPGAFTTLPGGRTIKVWRSRLSSAKADLAPGTVVWADKRGLVVACGEGALEMLEVQPEAKKKMDAKVFVNGRALSTGDILGS